MFKNRIRRIATTVYSSGFLAILALGASAANAKEPEKFVAHEWGTFSTFSGSDGKQLKFHPNDGDLPDFVYNRYRQIKGGISDVLVSLETPVLYFYSDRDRTVSVQVDFLKGVMTDWFPQASRPPTTQLRWDNLKILAKERPKLAGDGKEGRYFAARETDAQSLVITENGKREAERFLFYRGVGDFAMPMRVRAHAGGAFDVANTGKSVVPAYLLVRVQDRKVYFQKFSSLEAGAERRIEIPSVASTAEKLGETLVALLVEQGLYEKEARAMVKTWRSDWFGEEGTRILYLAAESLTSELLPLKISPKPKSLVRVLVGRHDVLTPERERSVDALAKRINGDSNEDAKLADQELSKLGRYRWAALSAAQARLKANGLSSRRKE